MHSLSKWHTKSTGYFALGPIWVGRGRNSTYVASDPPISGFAPRCAKFCSSFDRDNDAAAATVTTHYHHGNPYAPHLKVLRLYYGKTFCIRCIQVSNYFGIHRNFEGEVDGYTAFETLTMKYPEYRNRWISDDKWIDIIRTNYFTPPSKEKEEELKFNRNNMVRVIGSHWQHTIEDFTQTN